MRQRQVQLIVAVILSAGSLHAACGYARSTFRATGSQRPMLVVIGLLFLFGVGGFLVGLLPGKEHVARGLWIGVGIAVLIEVVFFSLS